MRIAGRSIGYTEPVYIVAEIGANHNHNLPMTLRLVRGLALAGADAVKIQTYLPDDFGRNREVYEQAHLPLEYHAPLFEEAARCGVTMFSTPGREWAVDWLEANVDPPAYKISSTSCTNLSLVRKCRDTGKPVIVSTGGCGTADVNAVVAAFGDDLDRLALLKCTASYPAPTGELNLSAIASLKLLYKNKVVVGFSDHTPWEVGPEAAIAAVQYGASIVERHVRMEGYPALDEDVSLTVEQFGYYVLAVRRAQAMKGHGIPGPSPSEQAVEWLREELRSD